jgi:hypothetical protein
MHETMTKAKLLLIVVLLAGASGCVVAPRYHDGYYDHDHDRYWHSGGWHPCDEHRDYCR